MVDERIFTTLAVPASDSVTVVFHHLAAKWSIPVILVLGASPHRFNSLRRSVHGISHRLLSVTLRQLENDGLVNRKVTDSIPPAVEYSLTTLGASFTGLIRMVIGWANAHSDDFRPGRLR
jgi:DNA-binding HxlR family transcriptional regulator